MASLNELIELTINGELGKLLIETFGGELGHTYPNKDSEFIIVYPGGTEPPSTEQIFLAVKEHYEGLGYALTDKTDNGRDCLGFNIIPKGDKGCLCLIVTITTRYPHDGHHRCVRVTTMNNF